MPTMEEPIRLFAEYERRSCSRPKSSAQPKNGLILFVGMHKI